MGKYLALILVVIFMTLTLFTRESQAAASKNVRFAPLGIFLGPILEFDFGITDHFTLGPSLGSQDFSLIGLKYSVTTLGVRSNYYFNEAISSSAYAAFAANYTVIEMSSGGFSAEFTGISLRALGGYHWVWGRHFNLMLGGGIETSPLKADNTLKDPSGAEQSFSTSRSGSYFMFDFSLGWAW